MIDLIRTISETAYRPAPGIVGVMAISVSVLIGLGGCAQTGREEALDEVATSIRSADASVTDISVERTKDGFASVLAVNVAIKEETIDVARLSSLLSASASAPGASDFTLLHFASGRLA